MNGKKLFLTVIFLSAIVILFTIKPHEVSAAVSVKMCNGVYIDQVDVSGKTRDEAEAAVKDFINELKNKGVAITIGDNVVYKTMGDFGFTADPGDSIDRALNLGKTGNLIKKYKDLKDIEEGSVNLPLTFQYDQNKIKKVVTKDVSAFNIDPVNASVSMENGQLVYTDHKAGSKVNIDETIRVIEDVVKNWDRQDVVVNAVVDEELPKYTRDKVELCNTLLGTYTTEYASSAEGRAANLANGARLINNLVLYPEEEFNAYKVLSPFTKENGYYVAGAYMKGKVIDSVGGGACQVTTTLYNAVLQAELDVTERYSHSMTISYVDLSRDAAIAETSKNFKFKNSSDAPILIQATTKNRRITFQIWGHEIRDTKNRKIKFESVVLSETPPPADEITKDPTKPASYQEITTPAHTGYKAELYKVVYEKGEEVSRTLVNTSYYQAAARCITVGSKPEPDKDGKDKSNTDGTIDKPNTDDLVNSNKNTNKNTDTDNKQQEQTDIQSESIQPNNLTNPDGELQGDIWDPAWDFKDSEE